VGRDRRGRGLPRGHPSGRLTATGRRAGHVDANAPVGDTPVTPPLGSPTGGRADRDRRGHHRPPPPRTPFHRKRGVCARPHRPRPTSVSSGSGGTVCDAVVSPETWCVHLGRVFVAHCAPGRLRTRRPRRSPPRPTVRRRGVVAGRSAGSGGTSRRAPVRLATDDDRERRLSGWFHRKRRVLLSGRPPGDDVGRRAGTADGRGRHVVS
jgi:hypothetical protein